MHLEQYEYVVSESLLDYEFYSVGPKGKIKKIISFSPRNINGVTYFNLGFGDDLDNTGKILAIKLFLLSEKKYNFI